MEEMKARSVYFVHPLFDAFFAGGFSILAFGAFALLKGRVALDDAAIRWSAACFWIINWPHFSATLHRLFSHPEHGKQYPVTAFVLPVVVVLGVLASFASTDLVAGLFVKLFLIWSPYHFSGQSVGIGLLYARRAGIVLPDYFRKTVSVFVFLTFLAATARSETGREGLVFYGISTPGFGLPDWVPLLLGWCLAAAAIAVVGLLVNWSVRERRVFPWIVVLPWATQATWFVFGPSVSAYYVLVPLFHSLQYLPIAWAIQLKSRMDREKIAPSLRYAWSETARWYGWNVLGGAALFWGLPAAVTQAGIPAGLATGILIAAVQIHHFFVDGVIWKLRDPNVGSPLNMTLAEVTGR